MRHKAPKEVLEPARPTTRWPFGIVIVLVAWPCMAASSLSGGVKDESFQPISGATVTLTWEGNRNAPYRTSTDERGAFTFSGLQPGEYTVRVSSTALIGVELRGIRIGDGEDLHLSRILLEAGEGYGNCVVHLSPDSVFRQTNANDVEVSGRVVVGRGENAEVTLHVFTESERVSRSTVSDGKGRFRFLIPVAGDIRLEIEIRNRVGDVVIPAQEANIGRTKLGDRLTIPKIRLQKSGLGHFCY